MIEIVINDCFGGFGLSKQAIKEYLKLKGIKESDDFWDNDIERDDKDLVAVVKKLKDEASGNYADLKIVEIPDGMKWHIHDYDGKEHVAEDHKTWH